jgi:mRNA interferase HigB
MKLLGIQILHAFVEQHADARSQIDSWRAEIEGAQWDTPNELKNRYPKASILKDRHVIFDICWNRYRIWTQISFQNKVVLIKNIGTHKEYDKWNIS